jgi:aerotaxis receptor
MTTIADAAAQSGAEDAEVYLGAEELFYSRTDPRGVILAGNDIFQRVSQYDWSELLGAPHRLVRHSDTPRGVFRILWDAIQKGHPMGAYVKNKAKSGGYYWVFAVVVPIEGGYLSVRLKPSSPLFDKVQALYAKISSWEKKDKVDPEEAAHSLRAIAAEEGFSSYTSFMAYALAHELTARDRHLRRSSDARTKLLGDMNQALQTILQEQTGLMRSFDALQSIPNNMRIVASRLEPSGGPVSSISENYKAASSAISERLRNFIAGKDNVYDRMSREVARALFLLGCERVVSEMGARFHGHAPVSGIDWSVEKAMLETVGRDSAQNARAALQQAGDLAEQLTRSSRDIRRQMLGLDTIRVLGRVECGRLREAGGTLASTIDQLDRFHDDIKTRLETITQLSEEIGSLISNHLRLSVAAAA